MGAAGELSQGEGHAFSVQDLAERLCLPADHVEELLLRPILEAWLKGQRGEYRACGPARGLDSDQ